MVALAGLITSKSGHIVLGGDPMQLGPRIDSSVAAAHGLQLSLLERIMKMKQYVSNEKGYNHTFIVKLVNNFRSNVHLLTIPSKLFYDNELKCCGDPSIIHSCEQFAGPNPLIFIGVLGHESRAGTSLRNDDEAVAVKNYVELLLGQGYAGRDIGVITPYRGQVMHLSKLLEELEEVEVGTVEAYQGREKKIIVISTVRSNPTCSATAGSYAIGFLNDKKRFNVAVTRARALLVVIGNPFNLQQVRLIKISTQYHKIL